MKSGKMRGKFKTRQVCKFDDKKSIKEMQSGKK